MRKFLLIICSVTMVVGMAGKAGAISFSDTKYLGKWLSGTGTYSWEHATPLDFKLPGSTLISATLGISGWLVGEDGTNMFLESTAFGSLKKGSWWTFGFSWTEFGIEDVFTGDWDAGYPLGINLDFTDMKGFKLLSSTFKLNYDAADVPVPEPATLLLLGFGLIGMAFLGRRNFPPKSHQA